MDFKEGKIAIIAPSGAVSDIGVLSGLDFNLKIFPSCYMSAAELTDAARLKDLHDAFLDDEVTMILCARGGYGALRILDKIDYDLVAKHPKIFAGSSDITLLLLSFLANCGLKTYHSQMALQIFKNGMFDNLVDTAEGKITHIEGIEGGKALLKVDNKGAEGILWGGNLATIVSLFGSDEKKYLPKENILLFLEDINEPLYKIDRMLTQIFRSHALRDKVKGLIFGDFGDVDATELLGEFAQKFNVPSYCGFKISHCADNVAIPVGARARLTHNGEVIFGV